MTGPSTPSTRGPRVGLAIAIVGPFLWRECWQGKAWALISGTRYDVKATLHC